MNTAIEGTSLETDFAQQAILEALRGLQFGSVTLIVQDGVIVQVERLEKKRLPRRTSRVADLPAAE